MVAVTLFSKPDSLTSGTSYGIVVSSGNSTWWSSNCPQDLAENIKQAHAKNELINEVSVASDGDWFLSTNAYKTAKQWEDPTKSRVARFCELATKGGCKTGVGNIKWIAFMPYTEGFIGVTLVDRGAYYFYEGIPASLETQLHQETTKVVRSVSVGYNGSWIVVYNDGSTRWSHSIPSALCANLQAGHTSNLKSVILSPNSGDEFIANYEDGTSRYVLQAAWKPAVDNQIALLQQTLAQIAQMNLAFNQAANERRLNMARNLAAIASWNTGALG